MKKYILYTVAVIAAGAVTGCKDFLTEEPPMDQSTEITLSTYDGLNSATAGAYSRLASSGWYGGEFILLNEMKTSNGKKFIGTEYDTGRMEEWYLLNYSSQSTSSLYGSAYYVISQANNVIDNLTEDKGEAQDLNNLKAECLFLRALSYFDLVRTYAQPYSHAPESLGVPIVLHTASNDQSPRATVAKVYEQIVTDLTEAERIIDPEYRRAGGADARAFASIDAIRALLSRVYLYMENWQGAADYATKVINSGNYSLWTVEEMTDGACYTVDVPDGGEVIFEIYGGQTNSYDPGLEGLWSLTAGSYGDAGCAQDIRNLIGSDPDDVRNDLFVNDSKGVNASVWHTAKYAGKGIGSNVDYTNVIVLRLAEMYLNRAEALSNGARIDGRTADMDLQTLAENRGTTAPSSTPDGIFTERQKELNWEGHLWFDLGRQGRSMTRTDVANTAIPTEVAFPGDKWAMPIPESEIEVNPNLEQNPGF